MQMTKPAALDSQPCCATIKEKKHGVGVFISRKGLQGVRRAQIRAERLKVMFAIRIESSLLQETRF